MIRGRTAGQHSGLEAERPPEPKLEDSRYQWDHFEVKGAEVCVVICTHVASFGLVELLLMSVLKHAVHHIAALPHIKQCLPVLVADLL